MYKPLLKNHSEYKINVLNQQNLQKQSLDSYQTSNKNTFYTKSQSPLKNSNIYSPQSLNIIPQYLQQQQKQQQQKLIFYYIFNIFRQTHQDSKSNSSNNFYKSAQISKTSSIQKVQNYTSVQQQQQIQKPLNNKNQNQNTVRNSVKNLLHKSKEKEKKHEIFLISEKNLVKPSKKSSQKKEKESIYQIKTLITTRNTLSNITQNIPKQKQQQHQQQQHQSKPSDRNQNHHKNIYDYLEQEIKKNKQNQLQSQIHIQNPNPNHQNQEFLNNVYNRLSNSSSQAQGHNLKYYKKPKLYSNNNSQNNLQKQKNSQIYNQNKSINQEKSKTQTSNKKYTKSCSQTPDKVQSGKKIKNLQSQRQQQLDSQQQQQQQMYQDFKSDRERHIDNSISPITQQSQNQNSNVFFNKNDINKNMKNPQQNFGMDKEKQDLISQSYLINTSIQNLDLNSTALHNNNSKQIPSFQEIFSQSAQLPFSSKDQDDPQFITSPQPKKPSTENILKINNLKQLKQLKQHLTQRQLQKHSISSYIQSENSYRSPSQQYLSNIQNIFSQRNNSTQQKQEDEGEEGEIQIQKKQYPYSNNISGANLKTINQSPSKIIQNPEEPTPQQQKQQQQQQNKQLKQQYQFSKSSSINRLSTQDLFNDQNYKIRQSVNLQEYYNQHLNQK